MEEALIAFSRKGRNEQRINHVDVRSPEHARKLWPLVSAEPPHELVTYRSSSFNKVTGEFQRSSHFARLPRGKRKSVAKKIADEATAWRESRSESTAHRKAKELIAEALRKRLRERKPLTWSFLDDTASDYPVVGDLLLGAQAIVTEHPFSSLFEKDYRLDAAVLGDKVDGAPLILAGIEVEFTHAFEGFRGLMSKTLGFPVISIDISEMGLDQITPQWADAAIQATTATSPDGRRKNFVYLHDLLYPQYIKYPEGLLEDPKHQFLVFAPDKDLLRLTKALSAAKGALGYSETEIAIGRITSGSAQSQQQLERLGAVVGADWKKINDHQCLRISLPRPSGPSDLQAHKYHTMMFRLLLAEPSALVGYKYQAGIHNDDEAEDIWIHNEWLGPGIEPVQHRMLPKRLANPLSDMKAFLEELQATDDNDAQID